MSADELPIYRPQLSSPARTKMIEDSKRPQPRFNGMADAVRKIVAEEGVGGLYRGLGPVVS